MAVTAPTPTTRPTGTFSVTAAATGAAGICLAVAAVQIALAAGAPLGDHVWGGTQDRVLPTGMRLVAGGGAAILTVMAAVIARRGGLIGQPTHRLGPTTWGIAILLALNTVGNLASTSAVERFVFGPAAAIAAALTALVAFRTQRETTARVDTTTSPTTATRGSHGSGR